jgi:choline dehydrogenase
MNPSNWTRSYSRSAYIDPLPPRSNLDILTSAMVTKINFDTSDSSNVTATGVNYQVGTSTGDKTVTANKEVILAAGSIGSPHLLLLSGVGPSDVTSAVSISNVVNLPGVGQHLTDHLSVGIMWNTEAQTGATLRADGATDAETLAWINGAEAYVNITTLFGDSDGQSEQQNLKSELDSSAQTLVPSKDDTVIAGYKAMYTAMTDNYLLSELGHVELLFSTQGQKNSDSQSITIQCALQHPFSAGQITLSSSDPLTAPSIDPRYLSHPFDTKALAQCLKLARTLGSTEPLSNYLGTEVFPGTSSVPTDSDSAWESFVQQNTYTEYHPGGSCAMLPLDKGGCVDPKLRVYGTKNVRVIDASVFPMQFASHLQLSVYAMAETGAKIVKAAYDGTPVPGETTTGSASQASETSSSGVRSVGAGPVLELVVSAVLGAVAMLA